MNGDSYGLGINDAGVVVGQGLTLDGYYRGMSWIDGAATSCGPLSGHSNSLAFDISNDDLIVGTSGARCIAADPTLWDGGQVKALPDVSGAIAAAYSVKWSTAVGQGFDSCTAPWNSSAYMWWHHSQDDVWYTTPLAALEGDPDAGAFDLSAGGMPVGFSGDSEAGRLRAAVWVYDDWLLAYFTYYLIDLGGDHSIAFGVNDFLNSDGAPVSNVVGYSRTTEGTYRAYLAAESAIDLGTLPGYEHSAATRLNSTGTVIGHAFNGTDTFWPYSVPLTTGGAFVWRDGVMHDLGDLIPPDSGWTSLNGLRDINHRGQIVGYGVRAGRYRAFLLTPECMYQGDLNDDRTIDLSDLGLLLADFGCTGFGCPGDVTDDGNTDLSDLGVQLANFGSTCD